MCPEETIQSLGFDCVPVYLRTTGVRWLMVCSTDVPHLTWNVVSSVSPTSQLKGLPLPLVKADKPVEFMEVTAVSHCQTVYCRGCRDSEHDWVGL